jgi:hypothetical protein
MTDDPKTFLSKKLADGEHDPEQVTNLESKEQREYYRFFTIYGSMPDPADPKKVAFPFLLGLRDYEQRMNMSKDKMRPEQLVQAIVGLETQENIKQGIQPIPRKKGSDVGQL